MRSRTFCGNGQSDQAGRVPERARASRALRPEGSLATLRRMANCYVCGRPLKPGSRALRRKVRTGEWLRRSRKDAPPTSVNVHFGMRVVCPWCARRIDRERARQELL